MAPIGEFQRRNLERFRRGEVDEGMDGLEVVGRFEGVAARGSREAVGGEGVLALRSEAMGCR